MEPTVPIHHSPWCEDQAKGHSGPCVAYGGSVVSGGTLVSTTAEAASAGEVVVLTHSSKDQAPVRLEMTPDDAVKLGEQLVKLGAAFNGGKTHRRRVQS